ncbi:unnamed protein product [Vitrella brassicaformis CCMP3155]|uniref:Coenzyme Q-binding protein COQ10 START domain-containing protein n=2 Tax=Vitrella brassicaformis TaxID=1169539 RepID=A0A0G4EJ21_VITBC|nr:unnamed protein product [Vitrella brassicaformis CCMP3155]|eukprot:CEL97011.1 unnamed protein product [Vitrella brassicaformis CCMP3155]
MAKLQFRDRRIHLLPRTILKDGACIHRHGSTRGILLTKLDLKRVVVKTELLPFPAPICWSAVAAIETYDQWLPFCSSSRIVGKRPSDAEKFDCVIDISFTELGLPFKESVKHQVTVKPYSSVIATANETAVNASFLEYDWSFRPVKLTPKLARLSHLASPASHPSSSEQSGTEVTLKSVVVFRSMLHVPIWDGVGNYVVEAMLLAFRERMELLTRHNNSENRKRERERGEGSQGGTTRKEGEGSQRSAGETSASPSPAGREGGS